MKALKILI